LKNSRWWSAVDRELAAPGGVNLEVYVGEEVLDLHRFKQDNMKKEQVGRP
jgi:hypothetical protein